MALKTTFAAGIVALTMAFLPASQAEAKTNVNIGIGIGTPGWSNTCWGKHGRRCGVWRPYPHHFYYAPPRRPVYYYDDYRYNDYRRPAARNKLSCGAAANLVDRNGFNAVKARDCRGEVYTFKARKKGHNYIVKVNAFTRRIVGAGRI